jgi:hypothetical protein
MPDYTYICLKEVNGHGEFEASHSIRDEAKLIECPQCKEEGFSTPVKRLISSTGKGVVELSGAEYSAKLKQDAENYKREVYSSEKHYASVLGEGNMQKVQSRLDRQRRS